MHRNIPQLRYGDLGTGGNLSFGKRFSVLNLGSGLGRDHYTGDATARFRDPTTGIPEAALAVALSQLGRDPRLVTTLTDFDHASGRFFAAAGITLGL